METAAKKKNVLALVVIASMIAWVSACLLSSAAIASSASASLLGNAPNIERSSATTASTAAHVALKSRAEVFLGVGLKSIERSELSPINATRYYDGFGEVALECLVAPVKGPIANSVFDTSGRRIGNFLEDPSILKQIAGQKVVYVTDVAEKSALKFALRNNPAVQASGMIPQVRYLHGYSGDVVSAASNLLGGAKRVSGHTTILNRQRIRGYQVEVHVGRTHGPHVHINRGAASERYIRLGDADWHTQVPNALLNDTRVREAILKAAFYGL